MPRAKTDAKFLNDYVDYLNEILNRAVTDSRLVLIEGSNPATRLVARYQAGDLLPLELRPRGFLFFRQLVRRQEDHVIVEQCFYRFSLSDDPDDDTQWVFRYEYNRTPDRYAPHSHFHINAVHRYQPNIDFRRLHFPAGRLSIEQILAHLIMEHGIEAGVENPLERLAESHQGFTRRRTDLEDPAFP